MAPVSYYTLAILLGCVAASYGKSYSTTTGKHELSSLKFVASSTQHGKHEVRVAHNGILALEVTIPNKGEQDLFYRLVSDGKHVVKLIYSDKDTVETCEIEKNDQTEVDLFLSRFVGKEKVHPTDLKMENLHKHLSKGTNFTMHTIHPDSGLSPHYSRMIELHHLKKLCRENHENTKRNLKKYNKNKGSPHRRSKREIIYPGTKWCGKGDSAAHYDDLGESRDEDKCCRTHDMCEYYIEGFTRRWGYFNARPTTLSHCDCDDRFETCLKIINTQVADMIGELYFNVAKTQCFVFKRVRVCAKRKWWGKCAEWEYDYEIEIKEPFPYHR